MNSKNHKILFYTRIAFWELRGCQILRRRQEKIKMKLFPGSTLKYQLCACVVGDIHMHGQVYAKSLYITLAVSWNSNSTNMFYIQCCWEHKPFKKSYQDKNKTNSSNWHYLYINTKIEMQDLFHIIGITKCHEI